MYILMDFYIFYWELFEPERSRKAVSLAGFEHAFLIRNRFVQTNFVRPPRHLGKIQRSQKAT